MVISSTTRLMKCSNGTSSTAPYAGTPPPPTRVEEGPHGTCGQAPGGGDPPPGVGVGVAGGEDEWGVGVELVQLLSRGLEKGKLDRRAALLAPDSKNGRPVFLT